MEFEIYEAKLKTGGKTAEQLKNDFESVGEPLTDEEIQKWIAAYNLIDGVEVIVIKSHLSEGSYTPISHKQADDHKLRDFVYQAEQDGYYGSYIDMREEFLEDWASGDYSPAGSLSFDASDLEIIRKLEPKEG